MLSKTVIHWFLFLALLTGFLSPAASVRAYQPESRMAQDSQVTAFDMIIAMNMLRTSYGLPALVEDPIIDAVAQSTAEIMAANQMSWHIGDVSGRLTFAGYGGGSKVWGTENFAVGHMGIDEIMLVWADPSHMIPAVNPAYCNVGAGIAKSLNGMTYYVLQAAYTGGKACGEYHSPGGTTTQPGGSTDSGHAGVIGVSQLVVPVKIATADADGKIFHVVQAGQSFWSIAVAYKITIKDIETWNNLSKDSKLQISQKLFIPGSRTAGYATPTPVGMILASTPDADGKIIHTVAAYQTLSTIATAYKVSIETILQNNGIQIDWPLQIGQELVINLGHMTPSPTPRPLTPIEKITPASDGKYYHTINSGETLSWIATLYQIQLADLLAWNGLNSSSIVYPDQKLVLQVTPPATETATPSPATVTPNATATSHPIATVTLAPTRTQSSSPTVVAAAVSTNRSSNVVWFVLIGLAVSSLAVIIFFSRKK